MASPHPHPDPEERPFPIAWEDDDTPGVSIHPLSPADVHAILAHLAGEPDDDPGFQLDPLPTSQLRRDHRPSGPAAPPPAGRGNRDHDGGQAGRPRPSTSAAAPARAPAAWAQTLPWRVAATLGAD